MQRYTVYLFLENCSTCFEWYLYPSSGAHNSIYSIWYLSNRYCYLPLSWKSWNWFECGVGIVLICFGAVALAFISGKLLYMFRVVSLPIIRSTHNCIYIIWYLSNRCRYLPLLWKSSNWFECGVGIVLICFGAVASAELFSRNK